MSIESKKLTREVIIKKLSTSLEPVDFTQALWEGGAAAYNRIDQWSDIDIYLVVKDKRIDAAFQEIEKALTELSPIKQKLEVHLPQWPDIAQAFYRLEETNEYMLIDLAVITNSSPEKFLETEIHGDPKFYFNKSPQIRTATLNKGAFTKKLAERKEQIKNRFIMFNCFVQKEINRGNTLEAIELYRTITLSTLIETLRIRHNPNHYDFKTRYIHTELPNSMVKELITLTFVKNEKDLQEKYLQATKWTTQILE